MKKKRDILSPIFEAFYVLFGAALFLKSGFKSAKYQMYIEFPPTPYKEIIGLSLGVYGAYLLYKVSKSKST